jgi:hypothetical protein
MKRPHNLEWNNINNLYGSISLAHQCSTGVPRAFFITKLNPEYKQWNSKREQVELFGGVRKYNCYSFHTLT